MAKLFNPYDFVIKSVNSIKLMTECPQCGEAMELVRDTDGIDKAPVKCPKCGAQVRGAKPKHKPNAFYTAEPLEQTVSKQDFDDFIRNYPRPLERDCFGAYDPPLITYNDFQLANRYPYSVVASTYAYSDDPSHYYYEPERKRKYTIVSNYEELFNSKTGYVAGSGE